MLSESNHWPEPAPHPSTSSRSTQLSMRHTVALAQTHREAQLLGPGWNQAPQGPGPDFLPEPRCPAAAAVNRVATSSS